MPQVLKCDLHIHSQFSDGKLSIPEIIDFYGQNGMDVIAITDHLCERDNLIGKVSHHLNYSLSEESFSHYMETIHREAERARTQYGMVVIPGYEITKNSLINHRSAHILILGITEFIQPELPVTEILMQAKSLGALTIAAHPFFTGNFEFQSFHLWSQRESLKGLIDAWEINCRKVFYSEVLTSGLPVIANSDFHKVAHFQSWKTKIFSKKNQTDLFQAVKQQDLDFYI